MELKGDPTLCALEINGSLLLLQVLRAWHTKFKSEGIHFDHFFFKNKLT